MKKILSLIFFILAQSSIAQSVEHIPWFSTSVNVLDQNVNSLGVAGYNPGGGEPPWNVAQWGAPANMQPSPGNMNNWAIQSNYSRMEYFANLNGHDRVYQLAQASNYCNHEMDLFLAPKAGIFVPSKPLDQLGSVTLRAGLEVVYQDLVGNCLAQGAPDTAQHVFSIVLSSTDGQTLFYQINLGNSLPNPQNPNVSWCPESESTNDKIFCLDDDVRNLGGSYVVYGSGDIWNNVEFLPRILKVITSNHIKANVPVPLNANPNQWIVSGMYLGQIVQGGPTATSRWYSPGVTSMPGGTFCNGSKRVQYVCNSGRPSGPGWGDGQNVCYQRETELACTN